MLAFIIAIASADPRDAAYVNSSSVRRQFLSNDSRSLRTLTRRAGGGVGWGGGGGGGAVRLTAEGCGP